MCFLCTDSYPEPILVVVSGFSTAADCALTPLTHTLPPRCDPCWYASLLLSSMSLQLPFSGQRYCVARPQEAPRESLQEGLPELPHRR